VFSGWRVFVTQPRDRGGYRLGHMLNGLLTYMKIPDYSRSTGSVSAPRARILRTLALLGQTALLVLVSSASALAATITVTTLADPTGASGTCSLRQAITNANGQRRQARRTATPAAEKTTQFSSVRPEA